MSNISRRLAKLEKTAAPKGRLITISVPFGQENDNFDHLLVPLNVTAADSVVAVINYAPDAEPPAVSVAPMAA